MKDDWPIVINMYLMSLSVKLELNAFDKQKVQF